MRIEFSQRILTKANGIQRHVESIRDELTQAEISVQSDRLFQRTEKALSKIAVPQVTLVGPLVGIVATGMTVGELVFLGVLSGAFLIGGVRKPLSHTTNATDPRECSWPC